MRQASARVLPGRRSLTQEKVPMLKRRADVVVPNVAMPAPPKTLDLPRETEKAVEGTTKTLREFTGDQAWLNTFNVEDFRKDIRALGKRLEAQQGEADIKHLNKIIGWSNFFGAVGILSMWLTPNPITILALSLWSFSRWTMIAHHTCHGGYTKEDTTGRFNRGKFAIGSLQRRVADWFDWMLPEAWNLEHNKLHHYNLGEDKDPDLVERNLASVRNSNLPMPARYAYVFAVIMMWKWVYYAPNTYKELKVDQKIKEGKEVTEKDLRPVTLLKILAGNDNVSRWEFFSKVIGPYAIGHFLLLPLPLLAIGGMPFFTNAVINLILADILTNIHSFITIVPNHSGKDMYRFETSVPPNSGEFYLRQILSSANYKLGNDRVDFAHGWLNYQIEHHMWPNLSMLSYQKSAKEVQEICKKHGVPYIQESVFERTRKTIDVMVGKESMRVFPREWSEANAVRPIKSQ